MGYAAGYKSGYLGGYLTEPEPSIVRELADEAIPTLNLELAFENFGEELNWNDESVYVAMNPGLVINRGRSSELDEFNVGTATWIARNESGRYDPDNESGPYFGSLRPRRQVRISVSIGQGAEPFTLKRSWVGGDDVFRGTQTADPIVLFTGETGSFDRAWGIEGRTATVQIEATDYMARLDRPIPPNTHIYSHVIIVPLPAGGNIAVFKYPYSGEAIMQLLHLAGWPTVEGQQPDQPYENPGETVIYMNPQWPQGTAFQNDYIDLDHGDVVLDMADSAQSPELVGQRTPELSGTFLSVIRQIALTEGGEFYCSPDGKLTFRAAPAGTFVGTWGDTDGLLPYRDVLSRPADELLINEVTVAEDLQDGETVTLIDGTSVDQYGQEARTWSLFPISEEGPLQARAAAILDRYSQPRERIVGFEPLGHRDTGLWRTLFRTAFFDRVRFLLHPVYGGVVDKTLDVQGINIALPMKFHWQVRWSASEAPPTYGPNLLTDLEGDFESNDHAWIVPIDAGNHDVDVFLNSDEFGGFYMFVTLVSQLGIGGGFGDLLILNVGPPARADYPGVTFQVGGFFGVSFGAARLRVDWMDESLTTVLSSDSAPMTLGNTSYLSFLTTAPDVANIVPRLVMEATGIYQATPGALMEVQFNADKIFFRQRLTT